MIFLSSFPAGLSAALPDCFLERRITYIMYSFGGLCIVCAGILPAVFWRACGVVFFWRAEQGQRGGDRVRKCWYPLWIFVKNRVSVDSGIGADIFFLTILSDI